MSTDGSCRSPGSERQICSYDTGCRCGCRGVSLIIGAKQGFVVVKMHALGFWMMMIYTTSKPIVKKQKKTTRKRVLYYKYTKPLYVDLIRYRPSSQPVRCPLLSRCDRSLVQSSAKLRSNGEGAKYVSWGFKAPVSMLLVPFFAEAWGEAKFLHVVRDGRDIAFSGNQTPVTKFYGNTFPLGSRAHNLEGAPLKAIAMWNSWNVGLYDWAERNEDRGQAGLDYLLLHTEDLIDPAAKVLIWRRWGRWGGGHNLTRCPVWSAAVVRCYYCSYHIVLCRLSAGSGCCFVVAFGF